VPASEHERIVDAMTAFGERLTGLPDCMREAGIDPDIVDHVIPSIDAQRAQLLALQSP
jgi:hypothetical protein